MPLSLKTMLLSLYKDTAPPSLTLIILSITNSKTDATLAQTELRRRSKQRGGGCSLLAPGMGPPLLQCICKTYMDLAHYIHFLCTSSRLCQNLKYMHMYIANFVFLNETLKYWEKLDRAIVEIYESTNAKNRVLHWREDAKQWYFKTVTYAPVWSSNSKRFFWILLLCGKVTFKNLGTYFSPTELRQLLR